MNRISERLALVPVSGHPAAAIRATTNGASGHRTPTLPVFAVTFSGICREAGNDQGEGARPELLRQREEQLGRIEGEVHGLIDGIDQQGNGPVGDATLDAKYLADRRQIERISSEAIKGVGGKGHHLSAHDQVDGVVKGVFEG